MAEPKGFLVVPVGFNPSGDLRALELDANDYLKVALAAWLEGAVDVKGYTGAAWKELLVNASGQAIVVGKGTSEEVNVALLAPARGLVGSHGWINAAWQKDPQRLGYSAFKGQYKTNLTLPAGSYNMASDVCPAGQIWVFSSIAAQYGGTAPLSFVYYIADGVNTYPIYSNYSIVPAQVYPVTGQFIVPAGGWIIWRVTGATLNDDLYGYAVGYRVDINQ